MQKEFRGVADPDQAWILGELIRYLEHTRSGALEFDDMGESWTGVRDAVAAGTLRATDKGIPTVVARFDALLRFTSLSLGRRLGTEVVPVLSRKELADPALRAAALTQQLAQDRSALRRHPHPRHRRPPRRHRRPARGHGHLPRRHRRPPRGPADHAGELAGPPAQERAGHRTGRVHHRPRPRSSSGRAAPHRAREPRLARHATPAREIRTFRVALSTPLGTKRGRGRGAFIDSVLAGVDAFYADVLGDLKAWSAAPPKMRPETPAATDDREPTRPASLSSTDFSSQDGSVSDVGYWAPAPTRPDPATDGANQG